VDGKGIRVTSYFGDRQRAGGRLVAEALTGLHARQGIMASIAVRGNGGLVAASAVGLNPDMDGIAGQAAELASPGLVAIEPTRLLADDIDPAWPGAGPEEATRLTAYFTTTDQVYMVPAFEAACELLYRRGIAGATVVPGTPGPAQGRRLSRHEPGPPLMLIAVDPGNQAGMILPELGGLFRHPVMTVDRVQVCKRDGQLIRRPQAPPAGEAEGAAGQLKLTVYTSEAARHDGHLVHRAITQQAQLAGASVAMTVRGTWGFHADHAPHGDHFPHRTRHVPAVTTVIGSPEQASAAFDVIDALTADGGLVTAETVLVVEPAARPAGHPAP